MKSAVKKRSIVINGHKTSLSVEDEFWQALIEVAAAKHMAVRELVYEIDCDRRDGNSNLSSAIRVFLFNHFKGNKR